MEIKLIEGEFSASESLELITLLINAKIKFHENKIDNENEEDTKMRERKITRLQNVLADYRKEKGTKHVKIDCVINFS